MNWIHRKEKELKNDEQDENSPVEMIEGRPNRFRTNETDGRKRLRLREEKGWEGGKRKQLSIELGKDDEARVNLTRNAPDGKSWEPTIKKPNYVILKKIWKRREVIQNTYVKISHQSDEEAKE